MANAKITELTENTSPALVDLLSLVNDPAGTAETQKMTLQTLLTWISNNLIFSGARVYKSTTQTISSTLTAVTFDLENYDTNSYHDNTTNNTRLTVPSTGYYEIKGSAPTATNTAFRAQLRVDGSTVIAEIGGGNAGASVGNGPLIATEYYLTSGQYVEFLVAYISASSNAQSGVGGTIFSIRKTG
jgi:hypothetical protein